MTVDIHAVAASYESDRALRAREADAVAHRQEVERLERAIVLERERADFWKGHHVWCNDILDAYWTLLAKQGL